MASELVPQVMCVHNSKEGSFECAEGCCGKMRWSTVRQGSIWINGLFYDQEGVMNDANHIAVNSLFDPESRKTKHLEENFGSGDMIHQGLICGESPPTCSLFGGQVDTPANEEVEKLIDMKMEIQRELVSNNREECETVTSMDTCGGTSSKNSVLDQTTCSGSCSTNGFSKLCLRHHRWRCYAAHDIDISEGTRPSGCVSDPPADDLTRKVSRACQEYSSTDDCNRSILGKEKWGKVFNTPQNHQMINERSHMCSEAENGVFSRCDEEQRDGNDLDITYKHAMYMEPNPAADSSDFLCEGEVRVSGEGARFPLIIEAENYSTEATKEEGCVSCYIRGGNQSAECFIRGENQSAEAENAKSLSGGCRDDGFSSNGDRPKSGTLPEEALLYALPYMGLKDILSMERVSKIFRECIRNDVLLWQQLHVERPLSKKLTDEALLELASRSKGQLQSLSLVDCLRITEDAVEHVVYSNPRLSKLCLPGCSRITPEAVLRMVKTHSDYRFPGMPGLKQLRLRNIYGLTKDHLDVLLTMLDDGKQAQPITKKPQFYQNVHYSPSCDDQRPIDVEACPKCSSVRLVYDCTRERCQHSQGNIFQECRACSLCIVRCAECGNCINDNDFEETFCLDVVCSSCWLWLPKCSECNRPSCGRHAGCFVQTSETSFVCSDCWASPGAVDPEFHVHGGFDI